MTRMIFVNLPVKDLPKSTAFYEALGFTNNPHFSGETGACMVWSEAISVMILTHQKWLLLNRSMNMLKNGVGQSGMTSC